MKQDISIVILTAGYGNGHIQVSRTLQQAFADSAPHRQAFSICIGKPTPA